MTDIIEMMKQAVDAPVLEEEEHVSAKLSPFDILNDITSNKNRVIAVENEREYNPFYVIRGLSQHYDTVLLANEMNKRPNMDPYAQYLFLELTVPAKKRYGKWSKGTDLVEPEVVDMVARFYNTSKEKALDYIKIGGDEFINGIKKRSDMGGVQ